MVALAQYTGGRISYKRYNVGDRSVLLSRYSGRVVVTESEYNRMCDEYPGEFTLIPLNLIDKMIYLGTDISLFRSLNYHQIELLGEAGIETFGQTIANRSKVEEMIGEDGYAAAHMDVFGIAPTETYWTENL